MNFAKEKLTVNGVPVTMLTAGAGRPLLFLHGAGTWHGFDFALQWAEHHRVMIPYHPGLGESGDAVEMTTIHDYVMHYLELIDQLGHAEVDLVGLSMGGRLAAQFTAEHRRRVRRLALVAPAGLDVPGYPLTDFSKIPPDEIINYITEDPVRIGQRAPATPSPEWLAERDREGATFVRLLPSIMDRKFTRWLHRLSIPSLLVWGERDRTTPVQQAEEWLKFAPGLQLNRIPGAGHLVLDEKPEAVNAIGRFMQA